LFCDGGAGDQVGFGEWFAFEFFQGELDGGSAFLFGLLVAGAGRNA
jgi:hypothetical protein